VRVVEGEIAVVEAGGDDGGEFEAFDAALGGDE